MTDSKSPQEVAAWIETKTSAAPSIWVEEPETMIEKGMLGKKEYTTYRIMTAKQGSDPVGVRHRFSEFEALRSALKARYAQYGVLIPQIPSKKVIGKGEWGFVVERMFGLALFCETIVNSPFLSSDHLWVNFATPAEYNSSMENPGEAWLHSALSTLKVPDQPGSLLQGIEEEIIVIEYYTKNTMEKFKALQSANKAQQRALLDLQVELAKWSGEEEYLSALAGRGLASGVGINLPPNDKPLKSIVALQTFYDGHTQSQGNESSQIGLFECVMLEHLMGLVGSMKETFISHQGLCAEIDSLYSKITRLESTRTPTPKTDGQLLEAQSLLENKQRQLQEFYKNFFFFSLPLFVRRRAYVLKRIASGRASCSLASAMGSERLARKFFYDIQVNSEKGMETATAQLASLSSETLQHVGDEYKHIAGDPVVSANHPFIGLYERAVDPSTVPQQDANDLAASTLGNTGGSSAPAVLVNDEPSTKVEDLPPTLPPSPPTAGMGEVTLTDE
jgi:hypothetical protein